MSQRGFVACSASTAGTRDMRARARSTQRMLSSSATTRWMDRLSSRTGRDLPRLYHVQIPGFLVLGMVQVPSQLEVHPESG